MTCVQTILLGETASRIPALVFGGCLVAGGIAMLAAQRNAQQGLVASDLPDRERRFLRNRIRRRTQVAGMILIMGIMIPLGDYSPELWLGAVATFAIYWMIVLGLAFWTILLAVGDLLATRTHAAVEMNSLNRQRAELENAARALQERQRRDAEN